jgi:methylase of polypeptide subunit release factors
MSEKQVVVWTEGGETQRAHWRSERRAVPPPRVVIADDALKADTAYRLASEGTALLWRGDFQNARQLLRAIARRADRSLARRAAPTPASPAEAAEAFHRHRQARAQRAHTLSMLLLPFEADHHLPLRRAPDVRQACEEAYGPAPNPYVAPLQEVLGAIGAHEWRKTGVQVAALADRIHPHYGVFAPVRGEYVDLVARAPLPTTALAFDIGTGTGVLAAVLARRGVTRVIATDQDPRALVCARENLDRLGLSGQVEVIQADLFPPGRAPLVVCNPPWLPARPSSPLERAVYDPDGRMLRGFVHGLGGHLAQGGEGWLILSDLAEHLGLRTREELLSAFGQAGLRVIDRLDTRPVHRRVADRTDPLHAARAAEVTSLWRLASSDSPPESS